MGQTDRQMDRQHPTGQGIMIRAIMEKYRSIKKFNKYDIIRQNVQCVTFTKKPA